MDEERTYRIYAGGEEIGEYTADDVFAYVQAGQLDAKATKFMHGSGQWRPIEQMIGTRLSAARLARAGQSAVAGPSDRIRGVYIILGIFTGWIGAHNFYAGRIGAGFAQLGLHLTGWFLIGLSFAGAPLLATVGGTTILTVGIWILIEAATQDKDGRGLKMR